MDSPGFEPGTLRMQSGCDTTTPQPRRNHSKYRDTGFFRVQGRLTNEFRRRDSNPGLMGESHAS